MNDCKSGNYEWLQILFSELTKWTYWSQFSGDAVEDFRCWLISESSCLWICRFFSCSDATQSLLLWLKATLILVAVSLRPVMTCATFLFCVCRKGLFGQIAVKRSLKLDMLAFHNTLEGFLRYSYESNYCRCQYSLMFPTDSLETAWQQLVGEWRQIIIDWLFIYVSEPR